MAEKKKYSLSNFMSETEQKVLFFILLIILCGTILKLYGYTPYSQAVTQNPESVNKILAEDYIPSYDLNKVSYEELLYIPGIGPSTATSIMQYQKNVGFTKVTDLLNIRGIGNLRFQDFKEYFYIEGDEVAISNPDTLSVNTQIAIQAPVVSPASTSSTDKIDINTATVEQLMTLKGIGQVRASDIVSYRATVTKFRNIEDIKNVKGIGQKTFEQIKDNITIGN
jgi:competence protein ComEA